MLEFIALNINSISTIILVLFVIGVIGACFCATNPFYNEYADTFGITSPRCDKADSSKPHLREVF